MNCVRYFLMGNAENIQYLLDIQCILITRQEKGISFSCLMVYQFSWVI